MNIFAYVVWEIFRYYISLQYIYYISLHRKYISNCFRKLFIPSGMLYFNSSNAHFISYGFCIHKNILTPSRKMMVSKTVTTVVSLILQYADCHRYNQSNTPSYTQTAEAVTSILFIAQETTVRLLHKQFRVENQPTFNSIQHL